MSGKNTDLLRKKLAERLREASGTTLYGSVKSVDEAKRTCKVQIGEIDYEDVLLYAVEDPDLKGLVLVPAMDSLVLVSRIAGSDRFFVALFSEIEKVIFTGKESVFKITPAGFTLKKNSAGLKKTLNDLLMTIQQLTVPTPAGPSGPPANVAQFVKIQQELSMYLEE